MHNFITWAEFFPISVKTFKLQKKMTQVSLTCDDETTKITLFMIHDQAELYAYFSIKMMLYMLLVCNGFQINLALFSLMPLL